MRKPFYLQLLLALSLLSQNLIAQPFANRNLSNLGEATSVNVHLTPGRNNLYNLGSPSHKWKNVYLGNLIFANGSVQTTAFTPYRAGTGIVINGQQIVNAAPDKVVKLTAGKGISISGTYPNFTISSTGSGTGSSSPWTTNGSFVYCNSNIGIGTTSPSAKFEVAGGDAIINGINVGIGSGANATNLSIGNQSLFNNTTGFSNMATGSHALFANTTGYDNSAFGDNALYSNMDGIQNTALGNGTLYYNVSGYGNTAVGNGALLNNGASADPLGNTTAVYNTANGFFSLFNNSTGSNNAGFGPGTLYNNTTGNYNTGLGAYADVAFENLTNATSIGYNAIVNGSNKVRIGNTEVTVVESSAGSWTTSDGRFKTNIKEKVVGLKFINLLRPVVYNFDADKFDDFLSKSLPEAEKAKRRASRKTASKTSAIVQTGFIGQEVAAAAKKSGYNFSGVHVPVTDDDNYSVSYEKLVVPLVKAVQELSAQNDEMKKEIAELKALILQKNRSAASVDLTGEAVAAIQQNIPNPSINKTTISYTLPANVSNAEIVFTDNNGYSIKRVKVSGKTGSIDVNTSTLSSGTYQYSLYVNGHMVDTKQMVLAR